MLSISISSRRGHMLCKIGLEMLFAGRCFDDDRVTHYEGGMISDPRRCSL